MFCDSFMRARLVRSSHGSVSDSETKEEHVSASASGSIRRFSEAGAER